jgi:hypothetical protein
MLVKIKTCRCCGSANITKNGLCQATHKQKYHCKACGKYGTLDLAQGFYTARQAMVSNKKSNDFTSFTAYHCP